MMADESKQWLKDFSRERSEGAFRELVRVHSPVVYGTALRMLAGDRSAAQDVTQEVFTLLATKAGSLGDVILSAWLYRQSCRRAANHVRTESRRRQRELVAANMMTHSSPEPTGESITGEIDAALLALPSSDRDALVLRYFEGQDFRKLGTTLGTTEEAARKRVTRAIEKLSAVLQKRGIAGGGASLGATMSNLGATPVPSSLVAQVTAYAMKAAPLASGSWTMNLLKPFVAGVLASSLVAGSALAVQNRRVAASPASVESKDTRSFNPRPLSENSLPEDLIAEIKRLHAGPRHALTTLRLRATLERVEIDRLPDFFLLAHDRLTTAEQASCFELLLERWIQSDPERALTFVIENPIWKEVNEASSGSLLNNLFETWLRNDPGAAKSWLLAHWDAKGLEEESFEGTIGESLSCKVADMLFMRESAAASIGFIQSISGEQARRRALKALTGDNIRVNAWRNASDARLMDLHRAFLELPDKTLGRHLSATLWKNLLESVPEKVARLEDAMSPADRFILRLGGLGVTHRPASITPMASGGETHHMEEVDGLATGEEAALQAGLAAGLPREQVLEAIGTAVLDQCNRGEALRWIDAHRGEVRLDDLLEEKVRELGAPVKAWVSGESPEVQIIEWASRMSDEQTSHPICRGAFRRMLFRSRDEAVGFLNRQDIAADLKTKLQPILDEN